MGTPFVIFDRDGTLIEHVPHLVEPSEVRFKHDLISGITKLRDFGFHFGMVTNQSVIGRGLATFEKVAEINSLILDYLAKHGIQFDFVLVCPHRPDESCSCRKPNIGLGLQAIQNFNLLPGVSYVVGDQETDLIFGKNLGCRVVQVKGNAKKSEYADYYSLSLSDAASWIVHEMSAQGR